MCNKKQQRLFFDKTRLICEHTWPVIRRLGFGSRLCLSNSFVMKYFLFCFTDFCDSEWILNRTSCYYIGKEYITATAASVSIPAIDSSSNIGLLWWLSLKDTTELSKTRPVKYRKLLKNEQFSWSQIVTFNFQYAWTSEVRIPNAFLQWLFGQFNTSFLPKKLYRPNRRLKNCYFMYLTVPKLRVFIFLSKEILIVLLFRQSARISTPI